MIRPDIEKLNALWSTYVESSSPNESISARMDFDYKLSWPAIRDYIAELEKDAAIWRKKYDNQQETMCNYVRTDDQVKGELRKKLGNATWRIAELEKDAARYRNENDKMREIIAKSNLPCVYCGLPFEQWSQCSSGFPGCARGDDLMCGPNQGLSQQEQERLNATEAKEKP